MQTHSKSAIQNPSLASKDAMPWSSDPSYWNELLKNKENGPNSTRDGALNRAYLLAAPTHVCSGPMQLRASTLAFGGGVNVSSGEAAVRPGWGTEVSMYLLLLSLPSSIRTLGASLPDDVAMRWKSLPAPYQNLHAWQVMHDCAKPLKFQEFSVMTDCGNYHDWYREGWQRSWTQTPLRTVGTILLKEKT